MCQGLKIVTKTKYDDKKYKKKNVKTKQNKNKYMYIYKKNQKTPYLYSYSWVFLVKFNLPQLWFQFEPFLCRKLGFNGFVRAILYSISSVFLINLIK